MAKKVKGLKRELDTVPKEAIEILKTQKTKRQPNRKPLIKSIIIWCTVCGSNYTVIKKDNKGVLIEQGICPHAVFKKVFLK